MNEATQLKYNFISFFFGAINGIGNFIFEMDFLWFICVTSQPHTMQTMHLLQMFKSFSLKKNTVLSSQYFDHHQSANRTHRVIRCYLKIQLARTRRKGGKNEIVLAPINVSNKQQPHPTAITSADA